MSSGISVPVGVANVALAEAGLPGVYLLVAALRSALWVLDHPEVNALNLCGNPRGQAKQIRELIAPFEEKATTIIDASQVFSAPKGPGTFEQCAECAAYDPDALCPQCKCTPAE